MEIFPVFGKFIPLLLTLLQLLLSTPANGDAALGEKDLSRADMLATELRSIGFHREEPSMTPDMIVKKEAPCTKMSPSHDSCLFNTTWMHKKDPAASGEDAYTLISSLMYSQKCTKHQGVCECAEKDAKMIDVDGAGLLLCLKENLSEGEECIHQLECKDNFVCITDAGKNVKGNIRDLRRFCSGSSSIIPMTFVLGLVANIHFLSKRFDLL